MLSAAFRNLSKRLFVPRCQLFAFSSASGADQPDIDLSGVKQEESVVVDVGVGGKQGVVMGAANLYNMKYSPKKLKERIRLVRGLSCQEALRQLKLTYKVKDRSIAEVIQNAVANAVHNHNLDKDKLVVKEIWLGKAPVSKKVWWCGRGKSSMVKKRRSHLYVRVAEQSFRKNDTKLGKYGRSIKKDWEALKAKPVVKKSNRKKSPIA